MPSWPVNQASHLVALRRRDGKLALDRQICAIYSANGHRALHRMVDSWMEAPAFKARRPIIREALALHREDRFKASVPTLLPHVEGVMVDIFEPASQKVDLIKLYKAGVDPGRLHRLLAEGLLATLEVMYGWAPFGTVKWRSRRLHRHAILHGRVTNYGSEVNSLKVFLLLDLVASEAAAKREADHGEGVA